MNNGLGDKAVEAVYDLSSEKGWRFARTLEEVAHNPQLISRFGGRLATWFREWLALLDSALAAAAAEATPHEKLWSLVGVCLANLVPDANERREIETELEGALKDTEEPNLESLLRGISLNDKELEQSVIPGKVNILTMHRAKGLTAMATIIVGAEDEYIPGRAEGSAVGDERRLLYVSLSRAKHFSFVTYWQRRIGQQAQTGREPGKEVRNLTAFLSDGPVRSVRGTDFLATLR